MQGVRDGLRRLLQVFVLLCQLGDRFVLLVEDGESFVTVYPIGDLAQFSETESAQVGDSVAGKFFRAEVDQVLLAGAPDAFRGIGIPPLDGNERSHAHSKVS